MKHLLFSAVFFAAVSGTPQFSNAQASVNLEKLSRKSKSTGSLKFIDNIEINPAAVSVHLSENTAPVTSEKPAENVSVNSSMIPAIEKCSALQFKYAMMMDREVESVSNTSLYNFIDGWWGTRYRYGGTDHDGIDCSAFCGKLMNEVYGVNLDRTASEQFSQSEKVAIEDLKEGDLVFFGTKRRVSHVGLYLGNNYFVHSSTSYGVTISSLTDDYYSKKLICGGRVSK